MMRSDECLITHMICAAVLRSLCDMLHAGRGRRATVSTALSGGQAASDHFLPDQGEAAGKLVRLFRQPAVERDERKPATTLDSFRVQREGTFRGATIHPDEFIAGVRTG